MLAVCVPSGKILGGLADLVSPGLFKVKLNVDENLPNFFEALEKGDKEWTLKEENNLRKNYVSDICLFIERVGCEDAAGRHHREPDEV